MTIFYYDIRNATHIDTPDSGIQGNRFKYYLTHRHRESRRARVARGHSPATMTANTEIYP